MHKSFPKPCHESQLQFWLAHRISVHHGHPHHQHDLILYLDVVQIVMTLIYCLTGLTSRVATSPAEPLITNCVWMHMRNERKRHAKTTFCHSIIARTSFLFGEVCRLESAQCYTQNYTCITHNYFGGVIFKVRNCVAQHGSWGINYTFLGYDYTQLLWGI